MKYAYISPSTNRIAIACLSKDCSLKQAVELGVIPSNRPVLELSLEGPNCKEDPLGSFFECWTFDNVNKPTKIVVNLELAKEQWRAELLKRRVSRLKSLDKKQVIALGKGDTAEVQRLEEIKQFLRDLPNTLDFSNIKNLVELSEYVPMILYAE